MATVLWQSFCDTLKHHVKDYPGTFAGREVVVREQATSWDAHRIKLTIIWSPEERVTGRSAEHKEKHAKLARASCCRDLEAIVAQGYSQATSSASSGSSVSSLSSSASSSAATLLFYQAGETLREFVTQTVGTSVIDVAQTVDTWITQSSLVRHRHHVYSQNIEGRKIILDEVALSHSGHPVQLTIVSPSDISPVAIVGRGAKAKESRTNGLSCIQIIVRDYNKKHPLTASNSSSESLSLTNSSSSSLFSMFPTLQALPLSLSSSSFSSSSVSAFDVSAVTDSLLSKTPPLQALPLSLSSNSFSSSSVSAFDVSVATDSPLSKTPPLQTFVASAPPSLSISSASSFSTLATSFTVTSEQLAPKESLSWKTRCWEWLCGFCSRQEKLE